MYIVNTTFIVMPSVHGSWYEFFTEKFLPSIEGNPLYGSYRFTRLLSEQVEQHFTYSLQIDCAEMSAYHHYMKVSLPEYREFATSLFDAEVVHFVSFMKLLKENKK
ncbi:MAG: DUF4286 family protein [Rikenellaceae bacterium]